MGLETVLVIGAGAAGLAAAEVLSHAPVAVKLLEGRNRFGGRMHSLPSSLSGQPVELGAEFIHGAGVATWEYIRAAGLPTEPVPDVHWRFAEDKLIPAEGFWDKLSELMPSEQNATPDIDFEAYLQQASHLKESEKQLARGFVEGFHAAPPERIGIHALALAEAASRQEQGERQFWLTPGYGALVDWLVRRLLLRRVEVHLNSRVQAVRWRPGWVEAEAETPEGRAVFQARRAVITLPLGVLQSPGAVRFEPELAEKRTAIEGLAMGPVNKLVMEFDTRFWPEEHLGFVHAEAAAYPTWWSAEEGVMLTAWAGGPRAERLQAKAVGEQLEEALGMAARIFHIQPQQAHRLLRASYQHDWSRDPFSRGAYSYTPAGGIDLPALLAAPMAETLFFAGEATDASGRQGTVHGALASGKRAAREILSLGSLARAA